MLLLYFASVTGWQKVSCGKYLQEFTDDLDCHKTFRVCEIECQIKLYCMREKLSDDPRYDREIMSCD